MKNLRISSHYLPVCLFTYSVAYAQDRVMQCEDCYSEVRDLVEKLYGEGKMDNKVTLVFQHESNQEDMLYLTYWDGKLSVGKSVNMFEDPNKVGNSYMKLLPLNQTTKKEE